MHQVVQNIAHGNFYPCVVNIVNVTIKNPKTQKMGTERKFYRKYKFIKK